jgi:hypothetical protein
MVPKDNPCCEQTTCISLLLIGQTSLSFLHNISHTRTRDMRGATILIASLDALLRSIAISATAPIDQWIDRRLGLIKQRSHRVLSSFVRPCVTHDSQAVALCARLHKGRLSLWNGGRMPIQ